MSGSGFLRLGGNLNSQLDGDLQGVTSALIDRLDGLNIDVVDDQVVGREVEAVLDLSVVISTEDGRADDLSRVLVEVIEGLLGNSTSDARGDSLASITNKVGNLTASSWSVLLGTSKCQL